MYSAIAQSKEPLDLGLTLSELPPHTSRELKFQRIQSLLDGTEMIAFE
jgi:hypothetical protein